MTVKAALKIMDDLSKGSEGGTVHLSDGRSLPTTGYYVGGAVETLVLADAQTCDALGAIIAFVSDAPTAFAGYWIDSETGLTHVDAVDWIASGELAAKIAREREEIAIWDVENDREVRL